MLGSQTQFPLMIGAPVGFGAARLVFSQLSASAAPAVTPNDARTTQVVMRKRFIPSPPSICLDPTLLDAGHVRFTSLKHLAHPLVVERAVSTEHPRGHEVEDGCFDPAGVPR